MLLAGFFVLFCCFVGVRCLNRMNRVYLKFIAYYTGYTTHLYRPRSYVVASELIVAVVGTRNEV